MHDCMEQFLKSSAINVEKFNRVKEIILFPPPPQRKIKVYCIKPIPGTVYSKQLVTVQLKAKGIPTQI